MSLRQYTNPRHPRQPVYGLAEGAAKKGPPSGRNGAFSKHSDAAAARMGSHVEMAKPTLFRQNNHNAIIFPTSSCVNFRPAARV
jgi:hypothetical protein